MTCEPADRLLQTLRVSAPGATDDMISLHLFNVMDEFFRRTNTWRDKSEMELDVDLNEYPLIVPAGSELVRILYVEHNGNPVPTKESLAVTWRGTGMIDSEMTFPDGDALFEPDVSNYNSATNIFSWAIYRPEYLTVTVPTEDTVKYPLVVHMVLTVSRRCLEDECSSWDIPEWMWSMFFQDWLDGTLARLYGMPFKPWGMPQLAVYHGRRFRNHMAFRKNEANHGYIYNPPPARWRFPRM